MLCTTSYLALPTTAFGPRLKIFPIADIVCLAIKSRRGWFVGGASRVSKNPCVTFAGVGTALC